MDYQFLSITPLTASLNYQANNADLFPFPFDAKRFELMWYYSKESNYLSMKKTDDKSYLSLEVIEL